MQVRDRREAVHSGERRVDVQEVQLVVEHGKPDRRGLDQRRRDGSLEAPALDCVPQRASQEVIAHSTLHEVVLRAVADRLEPHRFVVQAGHHEDRYAGLGHDRRQRIEAVAVGQIEVEQNGVERLQGQKVEAPGQTIDMRQSDGAAFAQHGLDQTRVARVVLDQQDAKRIDGRLDVIAQVLGSRGRFVHGRGSWTTASQKSPSDLIAARNSSISIGLVT